MHISVSIEDPAHLKELETIEGIDRICLPLERMRCVSGERAGALRASDLEALRQAGREVLISLPYIGRAGLEEFLDAGWEADGYLIRNLDQLGFLKAVSATGLLAADAGLYGWNTAAIRQLKDFGIREMTAPLELTGRELRTVFGQQDLPAELVVYGYYPAMISRQCLRLNTGNCVKKEKPYTVFHMTDRTGSCFHAVNHCNGCYNVIYNTVPVWLADMEPLPERIRFCFTIEKKGLPAKILTDFLSGDRQPKGDFTRGHYRRETL